MSALGHNRSHAPQHARRKKKERFAAVLQGFALVVAGVIGDKRFGYDLWGDTVNVASRMEVSSVPGRTQVSEQTFRRLADRYDFAPRGEVEVKGLGPVTSWYLLGCKTAPEVEAAH